MKPDDPAWLAIADAFHSAAFGTGGWHDALDALAQATGSQHGALYSVTPSKAVSLNLVTNVDASFGAAHVEAGGGDPSLNPRLRAALLARPLSSAVDADFITPQESARDAYYQEFLVPRDMPHMCGAVLEHGARALTVLAMLRTHREGPINEAQRRVFDSFAPQVRAAFRTQHALQAEGFRLVTGSLERLSAAAFICDASRRVHALTPVAAALVEAGRSLRLKKGFLATANHHDVAEFAAVVRAVAHGRDAPDRPLARSIIVHDIAEHPTALDVIALPAAADALGSGPHVLVLVRGRNQLLGDHGRETLQAAYRLAPAEADVAVRFASGETIEMIAKARDVSLATVRVQLRAVYSKMNIRRQAELIILVNRLH